MEEENNNNNDNNNITNNEGEEERFHIITRRLKLRNILESDSNIMHQLDTDIRVQKYLGGEEPPKDIEETLKYIRFRREHYEKYGFGRWAAIEIKSGNVIGWAGLKVEHNVNGYESFYDLGYRLLPDYWNQGYATELSEALLEFGFNNLGLDRICAYVEDEAGASKRVLEKVGLVCTNKFQGETSLECWYEISAFDYQNKKSI